MLGFEALTPSYLLSSKASVTPSICKYSFYLLNVLKKGMCTDKDVNQKIINFSLLTQDLS